MKVTYLLREKEYARLDLPQFTLNARTEVVVLGRRRKVADAQVERWVKFWKHVRYDIHLVDTLHLEVILGALVNAIACGKTGTY